MEPGQSKDVQVSGCRGHGPRAGSRPDFGLEFSSAARAEAGAVTITRVAISDSAFVWMALVWLAGWKREARLGETEGRIWAVPSKIANRSHRY